MSCTSFGSVGSSGGNSSLAWVMGNGGKGRLLLKFPFLLDKGWYQEQSCKEFEVFQHRKERKGFQHEFVLLKLVNRTVCRVERMGDPDARFDSLTEQGSIAYDVIQCFPSEDEAYLETSDVIAEVRLPFKFDILDVLKICRAIHEGGKTRSYTLQVFNCYFFSLAIQASLSRCIAHWEDNDIISSWLSQVEKGIKALDNDTLHPLEEQALLRQKPILFRLYCILTPSRCYPRCTASLLRKIRSEYQSRISTRIQDIKKAQVLKIDNVLWYSALASELNQFLEEQVQVAFTDIILERLDAIPSVLPSGPSEPQLTAIESLKDRMRSLLTEIPISGKSMVDPDIQRISQLSCQNERRPRLKSAYRTTSSEQCPRLLDSNAKPMVRLTRGIMQGFCQSPLNRLPYLWLWLWILHIFLGMWGLNLWALGTDVTPCILIDKEMEDFFNEIEHPRVITHCELDRLVRDMQALIRNRTIHWIKNPWGDLCDYLTQRVSVDLHEDIGGSKQTIRVAFLEQPKFEAISISAFQQHILRRISIQAQRVGRVWLGSAAGVQAELEEVLSRVWMLIREDDDLSKKVTGGGIKHLTDPLENSLEQDNDSLLSQTSAGLDPDVPPPLQNLHLSQATGGTAMDSSYFSTNTTDSGPPHNSNGGFTPRGSAESMGAVQRELKLVDTTLVSDRPKGDMMCFRDGRLVARSPKREHDISNSASPLNSQSPTLTALNGIGSGLPSIPSVEDIPALRHTSEYESSVDLATPYRSDDTESAKHILVDDEEEDGEDEALVIAGTKRMSVATETEAGPSSQLKTISLLLYDSASCVRRMIHGVIIHVDFPREGGACE